MLLGLDVGNTHILGGIFSKNELIARFRYATHLIGTADQFGVYLLNMLQINVWMPELASLILGFRSNIYLTIGDIQDKRFVRSDCLKDLKLTGHRFRSSL